MKKFIFTICTALLLLSCDDQPVTVQDSMGQLNKIMVVIENEDWDGQVGDTIRNVLAQSVVGIVRDEPLFTLNHVKPRSFKGAIQKSRNFLQIKKSDSVKVSVKENPYANPQLGIIVSGPNPDAVAQTVYDNQNDIIKLFTKSEVSYKKGLMDKVALNVDRIKKRFGIDLTVPRAYRYAAVNDPDFVWLRRNIPEGTMDLMIYEVDRSLITRDSNTVSQIIKVRDSIGGLKIPVDEGGVFQTEPIFTPSLFESEVAGAFAFETRGTWEVKNMFMAGPFINYAVYNKERDNWLILEGYVSAPNADKRNYLFEIEAILRSASFVAAPSE
ncbi:DUF4837 family protein [Nonlabens sp. SY33080]|uniref:DUF4837 family protein n=1 Tax=Nonlabens sp. SY33080 TaxID=2719911 RepID=UPI001428C2D1|nr:DUF4837 family protein [Nonlabens sp. SY33080]